MKIYSSNTNGIRVEINAQGTALRLFSARDRNATVREGLVSAGQAWLREFKPKRFTPYITRRPFTYPKLPVGLGAKKLRTAKAGPLVGTWERIRRREFMGWDPWSDGAPPERLERWWKQRNPNEYGWQIFARKRLRADLRRWAKKRVREEIVPNLIKDEMILPLVHEGKLRDLFSRAAAARATATTKRARLTITIPRGDRQAARVNTNLSRLPYWEFDFIRRHFRAALVAGINGRQLAQQVAMAPPAVAT